MAFSLFVYPVRARLQPCRQGRRINAASAAAVRLSIRTAGCTIFENALEPISSMADFDAVRKGMASAMPQKASKNRGFSP
jgi:hypothetical protein